MKAPKEILVFLVDDDILFLKALEHFLSIESPSLKIKIFHTGESASLQMYLNPNIVILDYYLNSEISSAGNGIEILKRIKRFVRPFKSSYAPSVHLTAFNGSG